MADFDPIFEVDAGAILAKLHLAGQTQVTNKDAFIVNTAIENPTDNPQPDKPGDTKFNTENSSGEYQVAIIVKLSYKPFIDLAKDEEYNKLKTEYVKANEEYKKIAGEEESPEEKPDEKSEDSEKTEDKKEDSSKEDPHAKESLTAKTKDKDDAEKKDIHDSLNANKNKLLSALFEGTNSLIFEDDEKSEEKDDEKDDEKPAEESEELKKAKEELKKASDALFAYMEENYLKKKLFKDTITNDEQHFEKTILQFETLVDKENIENLKNKDEFKQSFLAEAGAMQNYFVTFAGKDNAKKINPKEIVIKDLDADGSVFEEGIKSFDKIKDFKIEAEDLSKAIEEAEQKYLKETKDFSSKDNQFSRTIALIVGYKVDID